MAWATSEGGLWALKWPGPASCPSVCPAPVPSRGLHRRAQSLQEGTRGEGQGAGLLPFLLRTTTPRALRPPATRSWGGGARGQRRPLTAHSDSPEIQCPVKADPQRTPGPLVPGGVTACPHNTRGPAAAAHEAGCPCFPRTPPLNAGSLLRACGPGRKGRPPCSGLRACSDRQACPRPGTLAERPSLGVRRCVSGEAGGAGSTCPGGSREDHRLPCASCGSGLGCVARAVGRRPAGRQARPRSVLRFLPGPAEAP